MTTRPTTRAFALWTALALIPASTAFAWGPQGHRVIAKVAEHRLTPAAKRAIRELLEPGDSMPDLADWADRDGHEKVPGSAKWHFINVPIHDAKFDPRLIRDEQNVVVKIKQYRKILADRSKPRLDRQRAFLFLVHFVEDVHQPMHVGDNNDRGGNDTQIQFFNEGTNLHKLWDSDLIHRIGGNDEAWMARVEREITPETAKEWSKGSVDDWAEETFQAAKLAYKPLDDAPKAIPRGFKLDDAYVPPGRAAPQTADGQGVGPPGQRAERGVPVSEIGPVQARAIRRDRIWRATATAPIINPQAATVVGSGVGAGLRSWAWLVMIELLTWRKFLDSRS